MREFLVHSVIIGVAATVLFDLWNLFLNKAFGIALPNWGMTGRWFLHVFRGNVMHENIATSPGFANEYAWGVFFHYLVGISFAAAVLLIWPGWAARPTLLPALIVGWVTVGCGWFIIVPATGGGIAHSRKPDASKARLLNILAHTVFGFGMWGAALLLVR